MKVYGRIWIVMMVLATISHASRQINTLWPAYWHRTNWMTSLVHDDYIYLNGGGIINHLILNGSWAFPSQYIASLLRIDLRSSWTTANVTATYFDKPTIYPYARAEMIWTDGKYIYAYGGIRYLVPGCKNHGNCGGIVWTGSNNHSEDTFEHNAALKLVESIPWRLPIEPSLGNRSWERCQNMLPPDIIPIQGALGTAFGGKYYSLGGFSEWPYRQGEGDKLYKSPGLVSWNLDGTGWENKSSAGFIPGGSPSMGRAVGVPFGPEGVIIFLGGYTPVEDPFYYAISGQRLQDLSQIPMLDINSGVFTTQTATGDIPPSRWNHCTISVSENGTQNVDIYLFGGNRNTEYNEPPFPYLGEVFVLSLPSFIWTKLPVGGSREDERASHECQLVGQSQMMVIGGMNPTDAQILGRSKDPWPNGIGILDLNEWKWTTTYNSTASPYKRPSKLASITKQTPFPKHWDSKFTESLFNPAKQPYFIPGRKRLSAGDITGIVVGACVAIAIMMGVILCWRWRRKLEQQKTEEALETTRVKTSELPDHESKGAVLLPTTEQPVELNDQKSLPPILPVELGPPQLWELPTSISRPNSSSESTVNDTNYESLQSNTPDMNSKTAKGFENNEEKG